MARVTDLVSMGIDAEPHAPLPDGVLPHIASDAEQEHLATLSSVSPHRHWDRILFSAKESLYKAWFPLTRRWLDFLDAEVILEPTGHFAASPLVPAPSTFRPSTTGRWQVAHAFITTALSVPAES